jgi:hypothetical protein
VTALLAQSRDQLHERGWARRVRNRRALDLCPTCRKANGNGHMGAADATGGSQ